MYDVVVQLIGFAAMLLCVSCYAFRDSARLLFLQMLGNVLYAVQFLLLRAYSGCATIVVLVWSGFITVYHLRGKKWANWKGWPWFLTALTVIFCAVTWEGWTSLLPTAATIAFVHANWTGDPHIIRAGKLTIVGLGWMAYDVIAGSYGGLVGEIIGWCSAFVSLVYYYRQEKMKRKTSVKHT